MVTAFLYSVAGLSAIDSLVETVGMTLVHARVPTWKTFSTQEVASSFW
jgi:hypothetical protein